MVRSAGGLHTPVGRSLHRAFQTISDRLADMCKMRILVRVTSLASIGWLTPDESTNGIRLTASPHIAALVVLRESGLATRLNLRSDRPRGQAFQLVNDVMRRTYRKRDEARQDVFNYIEMFYSATRKHVRKWGAIDVAPAA